MTHDESDKESNKEAARNPPAIYQRQAPRAQYVKAITQMVVGLIAAVMVLILAIDLTWKGHTAANIQEHVFATIGVALAVGAGIELAYTLFTHGPDEALDPLMLGLSAVIILQLAKVQDLDLRQAASAIVYVAALGGTFSIRKYLAEEITVGEPKWPDPSEFLALIRNWLHHPLERLRGWRPRRQARREADTPSSGETKSGAPTQADGENRPAS